MASDIPDPKSQRTIANTAQTRQQKLAAALRDNLRKRKAQARQRDQADVLKSEDPESDDDIPRSGGA